MRKRLVSARFWMRVTPVLLLLAFVGIRYYQDYQVRSRVQAKAHGAANRWLDARAGEATHIEVYYGDSWPGSIHKHVATNDPAAMKKLLRSIRCNGSLTKATTVTLNDWNGYSETYDISVQLPSGRSEGISIFFYPIGETRWIVSHANGYGEGLAYMSESQFEQFKSTLNSVPGNRRAGLS